MPLPSLRLRAEVMEERILHSADIAPLLMAGAAADTLLQQPMQAASADATVQRSEIVFVDASVPDAASRLVDLQAQQAAGRPIEIVTIGAGQDGVALIGATLAGRSDITAVHVLAHGNDGALQLGNTTLNAQTLLRRAGELAGWSAALTADADLLLYGCDVAQTALGRQFVHDLSLLTGADVAASTDLTGAAALGGNWNLEFGTGRIESALAVDAAGQQAWAGTLAVTQSGASSIASTGAVASLSFSHTVNAGSDRLLVVEVVIGQGSDSSSVTYNGTPLTLLAGEYASGNDVKVELWYLVAPTVGSGTVDITVVPTWGPQKVVAGAATFYGVDQTSPLGVPVKNKAGSGPASLTVVSGPGELVIDIAGSLGITSSSVDAGQTQLFTQTNGSTSTDVWAVSSTEPGAASVIMSESFTGGSGKWAAIAVAIKQVSVAAPTITSNGGGAGATIPVTENTTAVTTVTATDPDSSTLTYSISGGVDAARFTIDGSTGVLRFIVPPNFEAPTDAGPNNVYDVTVQVSDGTLTDTQAIAVTVTNANDSNPVITSNGAGANASVNVVENGTAVTTVTATDADALGPLSYSISGGADAAKFTINASTGALSFVAGPNYEAPTDSGANNVYDVIVRVSDGTLTDTQAMAVTAGDANEFAVEPVGDANAATNSVAENAGVGSVVGLTTLAIDADATTNTITYSLDNSAGGRFAITATTGVVSVAGVLDYETATSHALTVRATSADGSFATALFTIAVTDVGEAGIGAIGDTNAAANSVTENAAAGTLVGITASAIDPDMSDVVTYSLADSAGGRFAINATTGVVVVAGALDAEVGTSHAIVVRADSTDGTFNTQAYTIVVADINEFAIGAVTDVNASANAVNENAAIGTPVGITASAADADATNSTTTYTLDNSAGGRFAIDGATGIVTVAGAIDREVTPSHAIVVRATSADGSFSTQAFTVTVNPLNDNSPAITSDGGGASASINVAETTSAVTTVSASDADLPAQTLSFSIVGGADQALFNINASTGVLSFASAPDFESPSDSGADNVYEVTVQVSDGSLSTTQAISVTVNPLNDNSPAITSDGGGASASINVAENPSAVTTVSASDTDLPAQTLIYAIVGGADQVLFNIDAATGVLSFATAPDFENPGDAGANNIYDVTVQVSDGSLATTQAIRVTVNPANDNAPDITSDRGGASVSINVTENTATVTTVMASDADLPAQTLTYAIVGGADQALFTIDAATGALSFATAPDFESPGGVGGNNVYAVTVQASDGSLATAQAISVTVGNINEAPTGNDGTVATAEDSTYTFGTADFGFSDPNDNPANGLSALLITTLPGTGTLANNGVAVIAGQTIAVADITAGGLVFTPAANANGPGDASFTFRVQDDGGTANGGTDRAVTSNTLTVDVSAVNDAPVGAPTVTGAVSEDQTLAADVSGISDADGLGGLSYQWLRNGAAVNGATGTTYTLGDADVGMLIRVQVGYTDVQGSAESLTSAATAAVTNVNDVPVLATLIARQSATQGVPLGVTLPAGTFTDIDSGDTLSYTATLSSGGALPSWIAFDAATGTFSGTPGNADVGTITVRFTAADTSNTSAFGDFTLAVANVNDAPVLAGAIDDRGIAAGSQASFQLPSATFTDPDAGDTLHYVAALADGSVLPAWLTFNERTLAFTATPGAHESGAFNVRVTARDDSGAAAQALFAVIVTTPVAPVGTSVADAVAAATVQPAQLAPPVLLAEAPSRPDGAAPVTQRAPDPAPAGSSPGADTLAAAIGFESVFQAPRRGFGELSQITASRPASRSDTVLAEAIVPEYKAAELGSLLKLLKSEELLRRLEELQRHLLEQGFERRTVAASTAAAATGLSIGYVVWLVRGGVLVSSMLSALPAWQMIDPLPVVAAAGFARNRRSKSAADDADVERLFDDQRKPSAAPTPMPAPDTAARAKPGSRETRR